MRPIEELFDPLVRPLTQTGCSLIGVARVLACVQRRVRACLRLVPPEPLVRELCLRRDPGSVWRSSG